MRNARIRLLSMHPHDEGVPELQTVAPLTKPEIEKARLLYFLNNQIISPEEKAIGLGDMDGKRMTAVLKTAAAAYNL